MSKKSSYSVGDLNPLLRASPTSHRESEVLSMLSKSGGAMRLDLNSNGMGYTSLMLAISSGYSATVLKAIIDRASESGTYHLQNRQGQTAWQMLLQKGKIETFKYVFGHAKCSSAATRVRLATAFYNHMEHKTSSQKEALSETLALMRHDRQNKAASFDFFVKNSLLPQVEGTDSLADLNEVPFLLNAYLSDPSLCDVKYTDSDTGMNGLHFAVLSGRPVVVKAVLAAGYVIQPDKLSRGLTPLHYVCGAVMVSNAGASRLFEKNRETILSLLLEKLRSMDKSAAEKILNQKNAGQTSSSSYYSYDDTRHRVYYTNRSPILGGTALHIAASCGLIRVVKMLLGDTNGIEAGGGEGLNTSNPPNGGEHATATSPHADELEELLLGTSEQDKSKAAGREGGSNADADKETEGGSVNTGLIANIFETDSKLQTALHICAHLASLPTTSVTPNTFVDIARLLLETEKKIYETSAKNKNWSLISTKDTAGCLPMHYATNKEMLGLLTSAASENYKKRGGGGKGAPDELSKDYSPFGTKLDLTHALLQSIETGNTSLVPYYLSLGCYHDVPMRYKHNSQLSAPLCVIPGKMETKAPSSEATTQLKKSDTNRVIIVTPLELAILRKDVKTVSLLLGDGAKATRLLSVRRLCFDHDPLLASPTVKVLQTSPLFAAVSASSPEIVAMLLQAGADANDPRRSATDGNTVLVSAIAKRCQATVDLLLTEGKADPNQQMPDVNSSRSFRTPLFTAIRGKKVEMVELLLNRGANPMTISTWKGWNVLHYAAFASATGEIVAKIMERVLEQKRLVAQKKQAPSSGTVIDDTKTADDNAAANTAAAAPPAAGIDFDINLVSADGFTPLSIACIRGDVSVVTALIEFGADIMQADPEDGWTPLHFAAYYNRTPVIEYLLKCGADRTARTKGFGSLHEKRKAQLQAILSNDSSADGDDARAVLADPNKGYPSMHVFSGTYTPGEVAVMASSIAAARVLAEYRVAAPKNVSGPIHSQELLDSAGDDAKQKELLKAAHEVRSGQRVVVVKKRKQGTRRIPIEDRADFDDYDRNGYNRYGIYNLDDDWESALAELDESEFDDSDAFYSTTDESADESDGDEHWAPPTKRYLPESARRK